MPSKWLENLENGALLYCLQLNNYCNIHEDFQQLSPPTFIEDNSTQCQTARMGLYNDMDNLICINHKIGLNFTRKRFGMCEDDNCFFLQLRL